MESNNRIGIAVAIVLLAAILNILVGPSLPDQIVSTWNASGEPSGTIPTLQAIWAFPTFMTLLLVVFAIIPRIDPLRANIRLFRRYYDWFIVVFSLIMFIFHVGILAFNLGYEFPFTNLVIIGTALLIYYSGVMLTQAKRNWFIGIRTPWTLSDDDVWNKTHQLGAKLFKLTAVLALVGLLFEAYAIYFLLVPLFATVVITVSYSYIMYERIAR